MERSIRVEIVDDDPDIVSLVHAVLSSTHGVEVVGTASDPDEGERIAREARPDVAIVDVAMPKGGGVHATERIKAACASTAVLVFSGSRDSNAIIEMLRKGASSYVAKAAPVDDLVNAIRAAARGLTVLSADIAPSFRRELEKSAHMEAGARAEWSASIDRLLRARDFKMVYQPIVELATRRVRGYEALARFGEGTPDEWFAKAWRVGLGPALELAAIEIAFASLARMPADVYLSVNLSPATLVHRGVNELLRACDPSRIVLEVTEHAEIDDIGAFQRALEDVRDLGVRVAVDDAGAGHANFIRLLQLVPDVIKLDRVLVANVDRDPVRAAIAASMLTLARGIGAQLTAEGVETRAEAERLKSLGVRFGQGYLFGRPGPLPPPQETLSGSGDRLETAQPEWTSPRIVRDLRG